MLSSFISSFLCHSFLISVYFWCLPWFAGVLVLTGLYYKFYCPLISFLDITLSNPFTESLLWVYWLKAAVICWSYLYTSSIYCLKWLGGTNSAGLVFFLGVPFLSNMWLLSVVCFLLLTVINIWNENPLWSTLAMYLKFTLHVRMPLRVTVEMQCLPGRLVQVMKQSLWFFVQSLINMCYVFRYLEQINQHR